MAELQQDLYTGAKMGASVGGGIAAGAKLAPFLSSLLSPMGMGGLGTVAGWGLPVVAGLGGAAMTYLNRKAAKEAYDKKKKEIEAYHKSNVSRMKAAHAAQRQAISSGLKGIGGGHAVGTGRAGTVQKQAVGQQAEIATGEREAAEARYQAAKAANKYAKYGGGSSSAAMDMLNLSRTIMAMLPEAGPAGGGLPKRSWLEDAGEWGGTGHGLAVTRGG